MTVLLVVVVAAVVLAGLGLVAERSAAMTAADRRELAALRRLRDRLLTLAVEQASAGEPFPTIVLDEIHATRREIEEPPHPRR